MKRILSILVATFGVSIFANAAVDSLNTEKKPPSDSVNQDISQYSDALSPTAETHAKAEDVDLGVVAATYTMTGIDLDSENIMPMGDPESPELAASLASDVTLTSDATSSDDGIANHTTATGSTSVDHNSSTMDTDTTTGMPSDTTTIPDGTTPPTTPTDPGTTSTDPTIPGDDSSSTTDPSTTDTTPGTDTGIDTGTTTTDPTETGTSTQTSNPTDAGPTNPSDGNTSPSSTGY